MEYKPYSGGYEEKGQPVRLTFLCASAGKGFEFVSGGKVFGFTSAGKGFLDLLPSGKGTDRWGCLRKSVRIL